MVESMMCNRERVRVCAAVCVETGLAAALYACAYTVENGMMRHTTLRTHTSIPRPRLSPLHERPVFTHTHSCILNSTRAIEEKCLAPQAHALLHLAGNNAMCACGVTHTQAENYVV